MARVDLCVFNSPRPDPIGCLELLLAVRITANGRHLAFALAESCGKGYQSTLDALPRPPDDRFLVVSERARWTRVQQRNSFIEWGLQR